MLKEIAEIMKMMGCPYQVVAGQSCMDQRKKRLGLHKK
ncbi:hypothetical protein I314_04080 [Cryptococcus bacillisporus CA1873]|uniref:Unplaced genomic scaffold supercont1.10, whole genome shotgun sequence n=2 Tax=Cryptococcus gattii TaxID=552467 RepID=A0A0D0VHX0_CRYGA|nr:hypothetical protein I312_03897 [Cryptococcus bacillisporus CA1280]KIR60224.1 hypothetical protein I314_04080 [Cryptococcus bacillisporus CA1873]|eukprot:KIR60224.1 hypothetical protein I314_04080 [Cryptococcus gattii CA1873]